MMQQLRAHTERANAAAARVVDAASALAASALLGFSTNGTTRPWNVMPCVPATAICTHGKPYERRLQEMRT